MAYGQQHGHQGHRGGGNRGDKSTIDLSKVVLKTSEGAPLAPELFSETAGAVAGGIGENGGRRQNAPKPSQVRKFFDELVMWEERVRQSPERFDEFLPFIRMLNAKAAYAKGRGHITEDFLNMIEHCLSQVDDAETLRNFKLFFEAFLGFYKLHGPKG